MMTKGGRSYVYKRYNEKLYYVGVKKKPTNTEVRINDSHKDMLKYTYVRDGEGLWTRIDCAQMLSSIQGSTFSELKLLVSPISLRPSRKVLLRLPSEKPRSTR